MEWSQVKVKCDHKDLEEVTAIMSMVDTGLAIEDYSDIEENLMTVYGELIDDSILKADPSVCYVSFYLPEVKALNDAVAFLRERFREAGIEYEISIHGVEEEDWANAWRKYYHPLKIGERLVVVPAWQDYEAVPGEVIVRMDPGMAFGSGTHETTRLCAAMLEKYLVAGDTVLDIGTGSGILSLFAAKLGCACADGFDIDPVAVKVAAENAAVNACRNVSFGVSDLLGSVDKNKRYQVVMANIVADILIRMAPDVPAVLAENGHLICSGVIAGRAADVTQAMAQSGLVLVDEGEEADWKVLVFAGKKA